MLQYIFSCPRSLGKLQPSGWRNAKQSCEAGWAGIPGDFPRHFACRYPLPTIETHAYDHATACRVERFQENACSHNLFRQNRATGAQNALFRGKKIKYLQEPDSLAQCGCISLNGMLGDMFVQSLVGHVSREGLRMSENASQISGSAPVATPVWRGSSANTSILTAPTHLPWSKTYIRVVGVSVVALQSGLVAAQMVWNRYSHACWGSWGRNFVKFGRNSGFLRFLRCQCVRVW